MLTFCSGMSKQGVLLTEKHLPGTALGRHRFSSCRPPGSTLGRLGPSPGFAGTSPHELPRRLWVSAERPSQGRGDPV